MIAEFKISGIHCNSCVSLIKMSIEELKGINEVAAGREKNSIRVDFDETETNIQEITKKIETGNYKVVSQSKKTR
ncbi:MAG: heavy-metal-associated domain-containing protein [Candidatus ainarchaeum sp.]|nr:heavy-metal-associated domain-containing protein [Candidatus ainarchaeum sp.]MDD5163087.1 heavy-metal-associated domain-containing protein [Candidatus ainarchaeum sp.]